MLYSKLQKAKWKKKKRLWASRELARWPRSRVGRPYWLPRLLLSLRFIFLPKAEGEGKDPTHARSSPSRLPAPRHGFGPRGHLPRRLRFWRRVPRGRVICLCFLHLSVNSCAISWFSMFPWRKWFQEKEATKDLAVYLIDASPKMFAPVTALVSSSLSSCSPFPARILY